MLSFQSSNVVDQAVKPSSLFGDDFFHVFSLLTLLDVISVQSIDLLRHILEELLREGIESGTIASQVDPAVNARMIGSLWTGALQIANTSRDAQPLREALAHVADHLSPAA